MRGLSERTGTSRPAADVFPPCAGVIGSPTECTAMTSCIPPVCGGYRLRTFRRCMAFSYSPRVRGLSVINGEKSSFVTVFPPHAGVIGILELERELASRIPPACGGYRAPWDAFCTVSGYSPRMRGLSGTLTDTFCTVLVFPPHAGVIGKNARH